MIEVIFSFFAVLPQAQERIDFSLEPGTILVAVAFFVLVNVLLAAALYPFFKDSSLLGGEDGEPSSEEVHDQKEMIDGTRSDDEEPLEEKVDAFLEEIHGERSG